MYGSRMCVIPSVELNVVNRSWGAGPRWPCASRSPGQPRGEALLGLRGVVGLRHGVRCDSYLRAVWICRELARDLGRDVLERVGVRRTVEEPIGEIGLRLRLHGE